MVIADCSLTNLISGYGEILEAEGWTFESSNDDYGYVETYYTKGDLVFVMTIIHSKTLKVMKSLFGSKKNSLFQKAIGQQKSKQTSFLT